MISEKRRLGGCWCDFIPEFVEFVYNVVNEDEKCSCLIFDSIRFDKMAVKLYCFEHKLTTVTV